MTGISVRLEAHSVSKRYASATDADRALSRAASLTGAGIPTPEPTPIDPETLSFPRLTGRSGAQLIDDLPAVLSPLPNLHRMPLPGLPEYDPFRRIRPRLHHAPPAIRTRIATLAAEPRPKPTATIHGDFHPGQVIASPDGTAWLIDLDDMALATPEADVGNLLAWLLTAPATRDRMPPDGWRAALMTAWRGQELHPATLCLETEIALIRRALKRAEVGDHRPLARLLSDGFACVLSDG